MKKYIINACMAVTLMAGATSCSNEELVEKQLNPTGDLMLSANIGASSRTSVDETGKATWVKGDKLYAWGNGSNAEFTLYEGAGKVEGLFTGELKKGYAEYLEKVAYPLEMVTEESGKVYVNLSEVNYGNSSAPMYGTISDGNVAFSNLTSMLRIRVKNMPDNATLTVSGTGIGGKAELKDGSLESVTGTKKVTVKGIPGGDKSIDVPVYAVNKKDISIYINNANKKVYKIKLTPQSGKIIKNDIPELNYVEGHLAEIWNGETIDIGWYKEKGTKFTLNTPAELAGLAKLVNEGKSMEGKIINLGNSMDMNNKPFVAIGSSTANKFRGKFDGKNKVISGLNVKGVYGGLFGAVKGAIVENLTIVDSKFEGSKYSGCLAAYINESLEVKNVVVARSTAKENGVEYQNRLIGSGGEGKATIDGDFLVSNTEELIAAINAGEEDIVLADGNYVMPDGSDDVSLQGKELTIRGSRNVIIEASHVDEDDQFVTGAVLDFIGVTLNFGKVNYMGFANAASLTYNDCAINGLQFCYGAGTYSFIGCDLNSNGAEHCVWTWGGQNVIFDDCDFEYSDRAVNCYGEGVTTKVSFKECTFTKVAGKETTGAIETNSSTLTALNLTINSCSVNEGDLWWIPSWDSKDGANTYTTIDGKVTVANGKQLAGVIAKGATTIYLQDGDDYDLNGIQQDGLNLIGLGDEVEVKNNTNFAGGGSIGAIWKAVKLERMNITNTVYTRDEGGKAEFTNVTFKAGFRQGYGKSVVFTGCSFDSNSEGYALHFQTDSSSDGGLIELTNCNFNGGKVHLGGKRTYEFSGCNFKEGTDFQVWSGITLTGCTVDGVNVTSDNIATLFPQLNLEKVTLK